MLGTVNSAEGTGICAGKKNSEITKRVQTEFLSQVAKGKAPKDAFISSLHAIDENYQQPKENNVFPQEKAIKAVKPEEVKNWLELVAIAGPMIAGAVDWVLNLIHKVQNENTQPASES